MNKIFSMKKSILAMLLLSVATSAISAEQSVLSVSGNVTTDVCIISADDIGKTVPLGDVSVDQLTSGSYVPVPFSFSFTGCDMNHTSVTAVAMGPATDTNVPGYDAVNAILSNTGTASGVGIGLIGSTSTYGSATGHLNLGDTSAPAPLTDSGTSYGGVLTLAAQIIPLDTAVTATSGTVASTAVMVFTYQ